MELTILGRRSLSPWHTGSFVGPVRLAQEHPCPPGYFHNEATDQCEELPKPSSQTEPASVPVTTPQPTGSPAQAPSNGIGTTPLIVGGVVLVAGIVAAVLIAG